MKRRVEEKNKSNIIVIHVKNNWKAYTTVAIAFLIGILGGVILLNQSDVTKQNNLKQYIQNFVEHLHAGEEVNKTELLKQVTKRNFLFFLFMWLAGSTVIGIPIVYALVAYQGFCLSYTISVVIATLGASKGILFTLASVLPQNLIYIPCLFALAVSGIKFYQSVVKNRKMEQIKDEIFRHVSFSTLVGIIWLLGGALETYISSGILLQIEKYI